MYGVHTRLTTTRAAGWVRFRVLAARWWIEDRGSSDVAVFVGTVAAVLLLGWLVQHCQQALGPGCSDPTGGGC